MKNLIFLIFLLAISNVALSQTTTWDGNSNENVNIKNNETITITIDFQSNLKVSEVAFTNSCPIGSILTATRNELELKINFCNTEETFDLSDGVVKITNADDKSLSINQDDSANDSGSGSNNSAVYERNLYTDAGTICFGSEADRNNIFNIWNIDSTNMYFEHQNISRLQGSAENEAKDKGSGILGFNATNIADGFAKFLVSRVKKEMAISFFKNFKKKIRSDDFEDAQTMFSSTYSTLDLIDKKIYDLDTYLPSLKQSFEYDVERLPNTFSGVIKDSTSQISTLLDKKHKASRFTVSSILDFGIEIKEEKHIGRALAELDIKDNPTLTSANMNYVASLQTLQLFSEAMRDNFQTKEKPYWISKEKLDSLIENPNFLKCFIGLITAKAKQENITFKDNKTLFKLLNDSASDVANIEKIITTFFNVSKNINQINNNKIAGLSSDDTQIEYIQYFQLASKIISVTKPINDFTKMMSPEVEKTVLKLSQQSVGLVKGIASKQYSVSLLNLTNILTELNNKDGVLNPVLSFIGKEGLFIAQIAEAENSDQVSAIIENFAAPIGSWRDKRLAKWNLAFDSYVGAGGYLMDKNDNTMFDGTVATPIGFSLTSPLLSNNFTIMTSIVDLGPIVAFRFLDDDSEISNIYLREIIAPGVFLSWNIDKTFNKDFLLKLNVGYQQFPLLDEVNAMSNTVSLIKESGFTGSINVNIPIMTLINQKK